MEPTKTRYVFKKGDVVIIKDKHDLIESLGEDEFGNPKTAVTWNRDGLMEHYYGAKATVTDVNEVFIAVDIIEKEPGLEYGWGVSADMLVPDDGSYIPIGAAAAEPLRAFMPKTTKPTVKTVWRSLTALKKKESLEDGMIAQLMCEFMHPKIDFEKFKHKVSHAKSFKTTSVLPTALTVQSYYPGMDIEELSVMTHILNTDSAKVHEDVKAMFMELARNKNFEKEFSDTPFTPYKRVVNKHKPNAINSIWANLEFDDELVHNELINSESDLKRHIKDIVVTFMDENKLHTLTNETIKVK